MDPINKAINIVMLAVGLGIFAMVVMMKIEVMGQQSKAEFRMLIYEQQLDDQIIQEEVQRKRQENF